ncbi:hypothetical protein H6P81_002252 [Aristolochia fimbriata]|uniref:Chloroplast thylakoid membrane n=1 Tax=Aristolochia fimbriata TaxID=158543 RepID=A0AAV7FAW3_ARIFI|nr:hypothetical protein H6P81_002252 [Aristolochia fimbriata]
MATSGLINSASVAVPVTDPPPAPATVQTPQKRCQNHGQEASGVFGARSRRIVLFSLLSSALAPLKPSPARAVSGNAVSFGISGPKEWLKEQKKKTSKYLLAPIDASRQSLQTASLLLSADSTLDEDMEQVRKLLRSASRDCVPQERNSIVTFQSQTGVEVCTFSLILKNAASLLDEGSPIKLKSESDLGNLIRSFTSLSAVANGSNLQVASERDRLKEELISTMSSLDKFEQGIKDCLDI